MNWVFHAVAGREKQWNVVSGAGMPDTRTPVIRRSSGSRRTGNPLHVRTAGRRPSAPTTSRAATWRPTPSKRSVTRGESPGCTPILHFRGARRGRRDEIARRDLDPVFIRLVNVEFVGAAFAQLVEDADGVRLDRSRGVDSFAADAVAEAFLAFQHEHARPLPGRDQREARSGQAAADDDQVVWHADLRPAHACDEDNRSPVEGPLRNPTM